MKRSRYILRSLLFHWRANLGVAIGAAMAAMVLAGALMVGDSVRYSLEELARSRLGNADFVMDAGERLFTADLARRMAAEDDIAMAAIMLLEGVALTPQGDARVNEVQVVGIDGHFRQFAPQPAAVPDAAPGVALVNQAFADRLGASLDDVFILRMRQPGGLPSDLTLAAREPDVWSRRLRIGGILDPAAFGHFTLRTTQAPPPTVLLPRAWLNEQWDLADKANVLLAHDAGGNISAAILQQRLDGHWRLADAEMRLTTRDDGTTDLQSDRVFIDHRTAAAVLAMHADVQPMMAYFVNAISAGGRLTPYSFAAAPGPPRVPSTLADHEALVNDWLADDLALTNGSRIEVAYYQVDAGSRLTEHSAEFTVAGIIAADATAESDRVLAPDIPGLSDTDNCREWAPGIPIDLDLIRDRDQDYWDKYGPLPKIYLTLPAAEAMWSNRFGRYTTLRFPAAAGDRADIAGKLRQNLNARDWGYVFRPAKAEGLAAGRDAVDFGSLFTGLSFFLIVAAIMLTVLMFGFNLQYRAVETGTLRALGFKPGLLARLTLAEGLVLVALGATLGGGLALAYNAVLLTALRTIWHDAVRTSAFQMHVRPAAVISAIVTITAAAGAGMAWTIYRQTKHVIRKLQTPTPAVRGGRPAMLSGSIGLLVAGMGIMVASGLGRDAPGIFFGIGALLLASLLALCRGIMARIMQPAADFSRKHLLLRGIAGQPGRSLACIALLAMGVFLVTAVAANRRGVAGDPDDPAGGTGGYRIWCRTTLPLVNDLNTARGRARYGWDAPLPAETVFTPLRLFKGDDASCLNLNRVTQPHILGVDPDEFDRRGAFTFAKLAPGIESDHPWRLLRRDLGPDIIPAIADQADIVWGLGKSPGDTLTYTAEDGRTIKVKLMAGLANSIFQGHILMDRGRLGELFPSGSGDQVLLVRTTAEDQDGIQAKLTSQLADLGLAAESTSRRLAEFNSVENTYLAIFMLLGGLGLLLGSAGMGIVSARNILERRAHLALMRAVGYSRLYIHLLLFTEHGLLAAAGTAIGALAALAALIPVLQAPGTVMPRAGITIMLAAILAGSLLWVGLAVHMALRGTLTTALRNE